MRDPVQAARVIVNGCLIREFQKMRTALPQDDTISVMLAYEEYRNLFRSERPPVKE